MSPETIDAGLRILSWCLIGFAALWAVTAVIGYLHRRAYNLTRAESGSSKNIKPDFLKVDVNKRRGAIDRGKAYDAVLEAREASPDTTAEHVCFWSRIAAVTTAVLGLAVMIFTTVTRLGSFQEGVDQLGSWDRFTTLVSQNRAGAMVAVAVIAVNVVETSKRWKKTPARR